MLLHCNPFGAPVSLDFHEAILPAQRTTASTLLNRRAPARRFLSERCNQQASPCRRGPTLQRRPTARSPVLGSVLCAAARQQAGTKQLRQTSLKLSCQQNPRCLHWRPFSSCSWYLGTSLARRRGSCIGPGLRQCTAIQARQDDDDEDEDADAGEGTYYTSCLAARHAQ